MESVGSSVKAFKPGDRVIIHAITSCSSCAYCRKGMPSHCTDGGWILGNTIDGVQAEYARIPHADGSLDHMVKGASDVEQVMISDVLPTGFECGVLVCLPLPTDLCLRVQIRTVASNLEAP